MRLIPLLAVLLAVCLALSSCDLFAQKPAAASGGVVGDNGADLTVSGVHIVIPAGAVPTGTHVEAAFEDRNPAGADGTNLKTLSKAFRIKLGDGLEPAKPLTVTVPVDKNLLIAQQQSDTPSTVAMMVQSEGASTPDLVHGTWDPAAGTITAQVPHLSWVWPVQLDLGAVMKNVRDSIMQSLGIEYPKPDCVDKPVTIGATTYKAVSPAQAWVCVGDSNGSLTVTASSNSPIPFLTTTSPSAEATNKTEVSVATAFAVAVAGNSGFTKKHQAILMPGADAQYSFNGAPGNDVQVGFQQFPAMLLVSILAKVFDVAVGHFVDSKALDMVSKAGCMQNIVDTSQAGSALSPGVAAGVVKSFFGCVGSVVSLSWPAQIVMAILSAGPQFLVASALGIINEFTGGSDFTATVKALALKAPGVLDGETRFVTLDPWHDGALAAVAETQDASIVAADQAQYAYCSGSEIAPRKDGFRCYWPGIYDPCFQSPTTSGDFLCETVDTNGKVKTTRLKNMHIGSEFSTFVNSGAPEQSSPVRVELTDGTICARSTGAGPQGVPGYPYWAGACFGPSAGVWRVGEPDQWKDDQAHYQLYPAVTPGGYWQVAISVGNETAPAQRFDVKSVYR
ncbi:hypothetical protein [Arthrobacter methylotrophus]|uniref:Uncharacterized protein n=1 Tax=Arthrobacter methylotrophus TaxID=121291 RepID=A0ABV5UNY5_9MICC